jgi:hypothetical protein
MPASGPIIQGDKTPGTVDAHACRAPTHINENAVVKPQYLMGGAHLIGECHAVKAC